MPSKSPGKSLEPWIGERGRIGVIIPSTNIGVEYDCQRVLPSGVTWHFSRFFVEIRDLSNDDSFQRFIHAIRGEIPKAVRDVLTAEVTHVMMGMSSETFWGGIAGNDEFIARIREQLGNEIGLTTGANALDEALKAFGSKSVAVVTPYQPVADAQVVQYLCESGYDVKRIVGMKCETANSIAHTPRSEILDLIVNELDGDDVDAIVQVGTNLSTVDLFPALERLLQKPLIPINIATIWHALRAIGVEDRYDGKGLLLEKY